MSGHFSPRQWVYYIERVYFNRRADSSIYCLLPVYAGAALLVVLLLDVALVKPGLLIEAFNPVSINIVTLVLCYPVVITHQEIEFGGKGASVH
ncbi:DoxX-like family protein [Microbulbifer sp.]|uniref:DoxX-like family protein n=1 Tax=Microbulbifer sp. TaxID=1908541 RepID=UPI003F35EFD3